MGLPNQLSIIRIVLTPLFVLLFLSENIIVRYISLGVFTIAVLTDWYDGYIARKYDNVSTGGKFLDPLADKVLVITSLVVFNRLGYIPNWIIWVIIIRDVLITSLRLYSIKSTKPVCTNFLGKVKTFGQLTILYYIYLYDLFINSRDMEYQNRIVNILLNSTIIMVLLYTVTIITVISGIVYLIENKYQVKKIREDIFRLFLPSESGKDI